MAAAMADTWGIGKEQALPWSIPADTRYLIDITTKAYHTIGNNKRDWHNIAVMGRLSWEASPLCMTPMPECYNIIISRNANYNCQQKGPFPHVSLATSIQEALEQADTLKKTEHDQARIFVLGGGQIYDQSMPLCTHILLTRVYASKAIKCDAFMSPIDENLFERASHEDLESFVQQSVPRGMQTHHDLSYEFVLYVRK
ncbi:dihydrofolate reductase [Lichtheimia hyalospora FSU 10163]|nr:dihydrofolate reductase [Lichtheimia hyalospora FSU 10163]